MIPEKEDFESSIFEPEANIQTLILLNRLLIFRD